MPIVYVQYHNTVQNVFAEFPPNQYTQLAEVCNRIVSKVSLSEKVKRTYEAPSGEASIHLLSDGARVYVCVAEDMPLHVCYAFLKAVAEEVGEKDPSVLPAFLKDRMQYHNNLSNDAVARIQKELEDVKDIMMENMERVLVRGERLDVLLDKSSRLADSAQQFHQSTRQLRQRYCRRHMKVVAVAAGCATVLIFLIFVFICGPTFAACRSSD